MKHISYGRQTINQQDIDAVVNVLKSDYLTQGPKVREFEAGLRKYCGCRYAVAVSSGTAALHLAYLAAGLEPADEVIVSANTCAPTATMLLAVGAKPVFCDIREDTYNIDETKIQKLITKKTKAVVPVHFAGQPCEMGAIWRIAKKYKLKVIEDAAHALGASYRGKKIGSSASDMVIFSFHPVKSITTGEGGAVLTNNPRYYQKLLLLRNHGFARDKNDFNVMQDLGFNYRLTDMQSALGMSQLGRLDNFIKKRRGLVELYWKELNNLEQIILPNSLSSLRAERSNPKTKRLLRRKLLAMTDESAWHLFVIRVKNPRDRLPLMRYLKRHGIGTQVHYPPVYRHPYYRRHGYRTAHCPNAELYAKTCISLPLYPLLTTAQVKNISRAIKSYYA